jgi:hypothetical protein
VKQTKQRPYLPLLLPAGDDTLLTPSLESHLKTPRSPPRLPNRELSTPPPLMCDAGSPRCEPHPSRDVRDGVSIGFQVYLHEATLGVIRQDIYSDTSEAQEVPEVLPPN